MVVVCRAFQWERLGKRHWPCDYPCVREKEREVETIHLQKAFAIVLSRPKYCSQFENTT